MKVKLKALHGIAAAQAWRGTARGSRQVIPTRGSAAGRRVQAKNLPRGRQALQYAAQRWRRKNRRYANRSGRTVFKRNAPGNPEGRDR